MTTQNLTRSVSDRGYNDDEITFRRLGSILWGGYWLILMCAFLAAVAGGYYAYMVAEPRFHATAVIEFKPAESGPLDLGALVSGSSRDTASINTEIEIIKSRRIIEQVVQNLNLTEVPEFNSTLQPPEFSLTRTVKGILGLLPPPVEQTPEERAASVLRNTTAAVRQQISVIGGRENYLFQIRVEASRPHLAAKIANAVAEVHIADQLAEKFSEAQKTIEWLSERVGELEEDLKKREDDLQRLESETEIVNRASPIALQGQIIDFRKRLSDAEQDLIQTQAQLVALRDARDAGSKETILDAFNDATLRRLADTVSDDLDGSGGGDAAFKARIDQVIAVQKADTDRLQSIVQALRPSLQELEERVANQAEDQQIYDQMRRELAISEELYQTFLTGLREASVQMGLVRADAQIMALALPPYHPFAPRRSMILAISMVLGAITGSAIVLFRETASHAIRSPDEIQAISDTPVMGEFPLMPIRKRAALIGYLRDNPTSVALEALRNLRTSLMISGTEKPPQVIMVTSTIPGEGKTTISFGLAHIMSTMGQRVLLLEGDIRRCLFTNYMPEIAGSKSWLQVMSGEASVQEAIVRADGFSADVMAGEDVKGNAADILSSERFETTLQMLREQYDVIIIDTPPVMVVADARIVSKLADAVLYCVNWNGTYPRQVMAGVDQIEMVGTKITGFVLSRINFKRMQKYSYGGKYYGYGAYGKGYYN